MANICAGGLKCKDCAWTKYNPEKDGTACYAVPDEYGFVYPKRKPRKGSSQKTS